MASLSAAVDATTQRRTTSSTSPLKLPCLLVAPPNTAQIEALQQRLTQLCAATNAERRQLLLAAQQAAHNAAHLEAAAAERNEVRSCAALAPHAAPHCP